MIVGICWYLSGLLLMASLTASAITVVPGHESLKVVLVAGSASISLLMAALAIFLHTRRWHWIRQSKLARNGFLGLAGLATLFFVTSIIG